MKKSYFAFLLIFICMGAGFFLLSFFNQDPGVAPVYIARLNGHPIPLSHYKIYLRDEIARFESHAGPQIWQTTINGVPAVDVAKNHALETIISVMLTHSRSNTTLTQAEEQAAYQGARALFDTFTPEEQEFHGFYTVLQVVENNFLQHKIQMELTQNYHIDERDRIFNSMYAEWRDAAVVELNAEVWDEVRIY